MTITLFIIRQLPPPACVDNSAAVVWPDGQRNTDGLPHELLARAQRLRETAYNYAKTDEGHILRSLVTGQGGVCADAEALELYVTADGEATTVRAPYWRDAKPLSDVLADVRDVPPQGTHRVRYS